jgi:hypothetical protein
VADIKGIRQALVARIEELGFPLTQVSPYMLNNPTPPCAYIVFADEEFPDGQRVITDTLHFTVNVLIAMTSDVAAQEALDDFISTNGANIKDALEEPDPGENTVTLGGLISDLQVMRCRPDRLYPIKGRPDPHATALGAEWTALLYP